MTAPFEDLLRRMLWLPEPGSTFALRGSITSTTSSSS